MEKIEMLFRGAGNSYISEREPATTLVISVDWNSDKVTVVDFIKRQFKQYRFCLFEEAINGSINKQFQGFSIVCHYPKGEPRVARYSGETDWTYCEANGDIYTISYSDIANQRLWMKTVQKFRFIPNRRFYGLIGPACVF